jgi:hypothetical protein
MSTAHGTYSASFSWDSPGFICLKQLYPDVIKNYISDNACAHFDFLQWEKTSIRVGQSSASH